jgi:hypothetical protein
VALAKIIPELLDPDGFCWSPIGPQQCDQLAKYCNAAPFAGHGTFGLIQGLADGLEKASLVHRIYLLCQSLAPPLNQHIQDNQVNTAKQQTLQIL